MHPAVATWTREWRPLPESSGWEWPVVAPCALLIGAASVAAACVPARFAVVLAAGAVVLAGALLVRDARRYFLGLMALALFAGPNKTILDAQGAWPYEIDKIVLTLVDLILAASFVLWFARSFRRPWRLEFERRGVLIPLLLVALCSLPAYVHAEYPAWSVFELLRMLESGLLYWFTSRNVRGAREARWILTILAAAVFLQAGVTLVQRYSPGAFSGLSQFGALSKFESVAEGKTIFRAGGTLGHPNHLALYLDLLIPALLALSFSDALTFARRNYFALAFAAGSATLLMTMSRGGIAATAAASALCFAVILARSLRGGGFAPRAALMALLGLSVATALGGPAIRRFKQRDGGAFKVRVEQYEVATRMIESHPFVGVGMNNYKNIAPRYDRTSGRVSSTFKFPVHNIYLMALAETGVIGALAVALLIAASLNLAWFGRWDGSGLHDLHLGVFFGLLAFLLHSNVDMNPVGSFNLLFFLLGLLAAAQRAPAEEAA